MSGALVDRAIALAARGVPVFPVKENKRPAQAGGFYNASTDAATVARMFADPLAALIAVPAGLVSGFDAIDVDVARGGLEWLAANDHRLPATRRHHTRSGGVHILFQHTPGMRTRFDRIAPGVEVRGEGGYIIWWPAEGLHAEGPDFPAEPLAGWPDWLLIEVMRGHKSEHAAPIDPADLAPPDVESLVALLDAMPNPAPTTRGDYVSVNMAVQGCIRGLEALNAIEPDQVETVQFAAATWAARWDSPTAADADTELARWRDDWSTRTNDAAGWRHLLTIAGRLGADVSRHTLAAAQAEFGELPPEPEPVTLAEPLGDPFWQSKLSDHKGAPSADINNALYALRNAPEFAGALCLDTFGYRAEWRRPPPFDRKPTGPRRFFESDYVLAQAWLQHHALLRVSKQTVIDALDTIAWENSFSSLRDYMSGLAWDGKPRADTWLLDHLGAADTPLNRAFGSKTLIAGVARAFEPGCKVDTMTVLEGRQGLRKSTALSALAGRPHWFTDHIPDLHTKDAPLQLQGIHILEHAEMATLNKTDAARTKAFLSQAVDRFRAPFARLTEDHPRQCLFFATVNPTGGGYLKDETGARRYWPVECGAAWDDPRRKIDAEAIAAIRDQLWAEAVARYRLGESWWLDTHTLEARQEHVAGARFDADIWTEQILSIAASKPFVRIPEMLAGMGVGVRDQNQGTKLRVVAVLRAAGFTEKRQRLDGKQHRSWFPPLSGAPQILPIGKPPLAEFAPYDTKSELERLTE